MAHEIGYDKANKMGKNILRQHASAISLGNETRSVPIKVYGTVFYRDEIVILASRLFLQEDLQLELRGLSAKIHKAL